MAQTADHYATLKIAPDADIEVVKAAYKALMLKYHPDRNRDAPAALAQATTINAAYEILGDPGKRAVYDQALASASLNRSPPHQPLHDDESRAREAPVRRPGFNLPRFRDVLLATAIWRAAGAVAALGLAAASGLYLSQTLSSAGVASGSQLSRVTQALDGFGGPVAPAPVAPHIIHIPSEHGGPLAWLPAQFTAPHYSRQVIDGVLIYRRDDPWAWLETRYRQIVHGRRPSPKPDPAR